MNGPRRASRTVGLAGVVLAVVVTVVTACDADGSAGSRAGRSSTPVLGDPGGSSGEPSPDRAGEPVSDAASEPMVKSRRAAMPEVSLRYMYARGDGSEGVVVSAAGITAAGRSASAYVPTRTGVVFASGGQVYDLEDGGRAVAIGPVPEASVFLQVDPTLRYVAWPTRLADGRRARVRVYDVVAHRIVFDRVLRWSDRTSRVRTATFGAARLRLVHLPRWGSWTFATRSDHALVTAGGQVVELRSHRVEGPRVSLGVLSPGLRYRASGAGGRHPWQVVDLTTGRDVTPAALVGPALRAARLTGWLGNATFGVLTSAGTWRRPLVAGSVCRVAGRCTVVWRLQLGADDSGLQSSNEIG